jgi:hypothetical protein
VSNATDLELVVACLDGDPAAIETVLSRTLLIDEPDRPAALRAFARVASRPSSPSRVRTR